MQKVDILLPIYNSYEETRNCIESILNYTNKNSFNLFLLDDKSPNEKIQKLTIHYSNKYSFIRSVRNEENLGFPANVNNGIGISLNDIVVLNSDTLVSPGWLDNLYNVAYSDKLIAAVNPISNYGMISGIPTANTNLNDIFGYSELINAFMKCKREDIVETPMLVGYCMYIKRKALDEIGNFDEGTFKRGYGEENDWCMRARVNGYKLAISTGAYVHHIGGVSFGNEKKRLIEQSREILIKRYPHMESDVNKYVKQNKLRVIRKDIIQELNVFKRRIPFNQKLKFIKYLVY